MEKLHNEIDHILIQVNLSQIRASDCDTAHYLVVE
jgi:hypothetical protein